MRTESRQRPSSAMLYSNDMATSGLNTSVTATSAKTGACRSCAPTAIRRSGPSISLSARKPPGVCNVHLGRISSGSITTSLHSKRGETPVGGSGRLPRHGSLGRMALLTPSLRRTGAACRNVGRQIRPVAAGCRMEDTDLPLAVDRDPSVLHSGALRPARLLRRTAA